MRTLSLLLLVLAAAGSAEAQIYFTGPYGPGGTWNLYELRGVEPDPRYYATEGKNKVSWIEAQKTASALVEKVSGKNAPGHLVTFAGPLAAQESAFVVSETNKTATWNRWIGLTDSSAFGGSESLRDGRHGLNGLPGDKLGWKWTDGEIFDYSGFPPNPIDNTQDRDGVAVDGLGNWIVLGSGEPGQLASFGGAYVVEYDINAPDNFSVPPRAQPAFLEGPQGSWGTFGIREVYSKPPIDFFADTVNALNGVTPSLMSFDYQTAAIDYRDAFYGEYDVEKHDRPFEAVVERKVDSSQVDNLAMIAHATIRIPQGQGGDWTFHVQSDDNFDLRIKDHAFSSVVSEYYDGPRASAHGSMIYYHNSNVGSGFAQVSLEPGDYDVELIYGEAQHEALVELTAARGKKAAYDDSYSLVGAPAIEVHGNTPSILGPADIRIVSRTVSNPAVVSSLAEAASMIAAPGATDLVQDLSRDGVAIGQRGYYNGHDFIVANTALHASSTLVVDHAGVYTFAVQSADGVQLKIDGAKFSSVWGGGKIGDDGQSLIADFAVGYTTTWGSVFLEPGQYHLDMLAFSQATEGYADVMVAPGEVPFFDAKAFRLLTSTVQTVAYDRLPGLELVAQMARYGDANDDGHVDLADFGTLKANFGAAGDGQHGDFDGDRRIDLSDFGILKTNFGMAKTNAVPEPSAALLAALGAALVIGSVVSRRR